MILLNNVTVAMETAARDAAKVQGVRSETAHKISTRPKRTLNRKSTVKPANNRSSARQLTC